MEIDEIQFIVAEIDRHRIRKLQFEFLQSSQVSKAAKTEAAGAAITGPAEETPPIGGLCKAYPTKAQPKGE